MIETKHEYNMKHNWHESMIKMKFTNNNNKIKDNKVRSIEITILELI